VPSTPATTQETGGDTGEDTAVLTRRIIAVLRRLPTWGHHEELRARLMSMLANHEQTGDTSEFEHFTESLVMTARMERSPAFLAAASVGETPGEPRDIRDVVAEIEARNDAAGT
jgi:hypothetical protein